MSFEIDKKYETLRYNMVSPIELEIQTLSLKSGKNFKWVIDLPRLKDFFDNPGPATCNNITYMVTFVRSPGDWATLHRRAEVMDTNYLENFSKHLWEIDFPEEFAPKSLKKVWLSLGLSGTGELELPEGFFVSL